MSRCAADASSRSAGLALSGALRKLGVAILAASAAVLPIGSGPVADAVPLSVRPAAVLSAAAAEDGSATPTAPSRDGILLSHDELMALPTSGPGWKAVMNRVRKPFGGSYVLATRDESNKDVLAYALAGARLDDLEYLQFVRDKIEHMMDAPRDENDILGTLRHLQTYVISADLIDLQTFDPELDARFRTWLAAEIRFEYAGGGGGGSVISTHEKKPNNFGTHAGATRIAAALYLGDRDELRAARDVWYGWATGDPDFLPPEQVWTGTSWQCDPDRPAGINPVDCSRDGHSLDGVIPEDQERCGEYSWPPCSTNYIHGAADGMTLSFWMLARQGEDPWSWGDRAALRQMQWKYQVDQPPYSGFKWQIPVIEQAYGIDLDGNDPGATSTNFGYADWWTDPPQRNGPQQSGPQQSGPQQSGPQPDSEGDEWRAGVVVAGGVAVILLAAAAGLVVRRRRRR